MLLYQSVSTGKNIIMSNTNLIDLVPQHSNEQNDLKESAILNEKLFVSYDDELKQTAI